MRVVDRKELLNMRYFKASAVIVLMIMFLSLFTMAGGAQPSCAPDPMSAGTSALVAQDYPAAITAFTCAIIQDPANYNAYASRMRAALFAGRFVQAVSDANALRDYARPVFDMELQSVSFEISANPNDVRSYMVRALMLWADAQDNQALADYQAILSLDPSNVFALLFRGSSNQYLGDRLTPADDFADAIRLSGQNADVYALIGSTYAQTRDFDQAMIHLNQAIQRDPTNARSYYFMGVVFLAQNRYAQAIERFTTAISLDPAYAEPYYDRGLAYGQQNDYAAAIADFTQAIAINPNYRLAYLSRAVVYDEMGQDAAALADFARYVELNTLASFEGDFLFSDLPVIADMDDGRVFRYPLVLEAGQTVTLTAVSANNRSDPLLMLLAPDGTPVAANDDQVLGQFTSVIENFQAPTAGAYTVLLTHSDGGYRGRIDLTAQVR
jgi:tetratricopeptide (TPR) repeat protein